MSDREIFLMLLKKSIRPAAVLPDMKLNTLTVENWEELMRLATEHSVLPMIYEVVRKEDPWQMLPDEMKNYYKSYAKRMVVMQSMTASFMMEIYRDFLRADIRVLIIKGMILRNIYPYPEYRTSSDEDLLIRKEDLKNVDELLLSKGFKRAEMDIFKETHEISYHHMASSLHIEVHLTLFPEESGAYGSLNREFPDIFTRCKAQTIKGQEIWTLDETQHMLYLLCHGLKHFLHSGFGIRQLLDMIMFAETYGSSIDWEEVITRMKEENMYVFAMNLFDIGERYFGFSWEKAALQKPDGKILDSKNLLDDLLDSGVYGKASEERTHSSNITLKAAENKEGKAKNARTLFPDIEYMKRQYKYLEKLPFLLPAAWLQRIAGYLLKNDAKQMKETVEIGNKRVELLKKYDIIP